MGSMEGKILSDLFQTLYAGTNKQFQNEDNGVSRDEYPKG